MKFAELFSVSLIDRGSRFVELWVAALSDLEPQALEGACVRATQTCKFFPTPAEIRSHIDGAQSKALELEAQQQWENALRVAREFFHPDIGLYRTAPKLSAVTWHALRVAGGLYHLSQCPDGELQWARKRFIADYELVKQVEKEQHLLGDGEARRVLERLARGGDEAPRQLPSAKPTDDREVLREVRRARRALVSGPSGIAVMSEEEFTDLRRREKERVVAWVAEHPELVPPKTVSPGTSQTIDFSPPPLAADAPQQTLVSGAQP